MALYRCGMANNNNQPTVLELTIYAGSSSSSTSSTTLIGGVSFPNDRYSRVTYVSGTGTLRVLNGSTVLAHLNTAGSYQNILGVTDLQVDVNGTFGSRPSIVVRFEYNSADTVNVSN